MAKLEPISLLRFHKGCGFFSSFLNSIIKESICHLIVIFGGSKKQSIISLFGGKISSNFSSVSSTTGEGFGRRSFERGKHQIKLDCSMVPLNSIKYDSTVTDSAMKLFAACKYVNHGTIIVLYVGKGCVSGCSKEGVFNSQFVGKI